MTVHRCPLPDSPAAGARSWRCPSCQSRYVWSKRMINRQTREGWERMRDDFETRRLRNDAEFRHAARHMALAGVSAVLLIIGFVIWAVLRVTS